MKKRILTILLLAAILIFPIMSVSVLADEEVTDGKILNIPFEKNADTLIVPENSGGTIQATIDPDTWFAGLLDSYSAGFFEGGFTGGAMSVWNGKISDGCITFDEVVYNTTASAHLKDFEGAKKYKIPFDELVDGEPDSYILSTSVPYGKEQAPASLKIDLSQTPSSAIYFIVNRRGSAEFNASVKYTDGTAQSCTVNGVQSDNVAGSVGKAIYEQVTASVDEAGKTVIVREEGRSIRAASYISLGYDSYITSKIANGVRDTTAEQTSNKTRNAVLYELRLNTAKIPESVTFSTDVIYPAAIYSVAQAELTNEELMAVVTEAEEILASSLTADNIDTVIRASKYAQILEGRNYSYDFSKIQNFAYTSSIPNGAKNLFDINSLEFVWAEALDVDGLTMSVTENGEQYNDYTCGQTGNTYTLAFANGLNGEKTYRITFDNVLVKGKNTPLSVPAYEIQTGGIYTSVNTRCNNAVAVGGNTQLEFYGLTTNNNLVELSFADIDLSSDSNIFTTSADGSISSADRGFAEIKAVYTDPNTSNTNGDNGTNVFTSYIPVYSYMSKNENISIPASNVDFSFKNGVIKLVFTDALQNNLEVLTDDITVKTTEDKYVIADCEITRTAEQHTLEILKYEGVISVYFDGAKVKPAIEAKSSGSFCINGNMQVDSAAVYNLTGNLCAASYVNVRNLNGIKAVYSYSDSDKDAEEGTSFKWYYSYTQTGAYSEVPGQTTDTFTAAGYEGRYIKVEVTPKNKYEEGAAVMCEEPYYIPVDTSSASSSGVTGSVASSASASKNTDYTLSGDALSPGAAEEITAIVYKDVSSKHWAYGAIASLTQKKVLNGFEDGSFRPENPVTRAEFLCALLKYKGDTVTAYAGAFEDVSSEDWYAPYVQKAYDKKYVMGDGARFNPNSYITREEMAVIISRVFKITKGETLAFSDADEISDWAYEAVSALVYKNIINGKENNIFDPKSNATRAEMAVIFERIDN